MPATATATPTRVDCVFIRKSGRAQEHAAQVENVKRMLLAGDVHVPDDRWFVTTVPRAKVAGDPEFQRLMKLVRAGKVGTVYVEKQDRFGTDDDNELRAVIETFRQQGTTLFDLTARLDLTAGDDATDLQRFFGSFKSKAERKDLSQRSQRGRVHRAKEVGSYPGKNPYGYGKRCYGPDGKVKWTWQPRFMDRGERPETAGGRAKTVRWAVLRGQVFDAEGNPIAGQSAEPLPPRERHERHNYVRLVPADDPQAVATVRLVFELFVNAGLSRRAICKRLNAEGRTLHGRPWNHMMIAEVLRNPAYRGDTHFGRTTAARYYRFEGDGTLTALHGLGKKQPRRAVGRVVRAGTHEPLVDPATWDRAAERLAGEQQANAEARKRFSPRRPEFSLKGLLVCGHCGKGMIGRTQRTPGGKVTHGYQCQTGSSAKVDGRPCGCGFQFISHAAAEAMLLAKAREMGAEYEVLHAAGARDNLQERLARLGLDEDEAYDRWEGWITDGLDAFGAYMAHTHGVRLSDVPGPDGKSLRLLASNFYTLGDEDGAGGRSLKRLAKGLTDLRAAVTEAEAWATAHAKARLAELEEERRQLARAWYKAPDHMQADLEAEAARLAAEADGWRERSTPLSERCAAMRAAEEQREAEREKLLEEWPALDARERAEGLRRVLGTVRLYWRREFHGANPLADKRRKTDRKGRFRYHLDRAEYQLPVADLVGSC